jgi:uncharacterized protein YcfJ
MKRKIIVLLGVLAMTPALVKADYCPDCAPGTRYERHKHTKQHRQHAKFYSSASHRHGKNHSSFRNKENYGRVVDVETIYKYYTQTTYHSSCAQRDVQDPGGRNWTPVILGAVLGGAVGHRIGDSYGDANVAAVAGGLLGASIGNDVARHNQNGRNMRVSGPCRSYEQEERRRKPVEYVVTYRYNGQVYRTHMDHDPGEWVELDVTVKPA